MTNDALATYYANLLIAQYVTQPKAYAMIKAIALQATMDQLPLQVRDAFSIASATGVQLDVIGQIVGVTRNVNTFSGPVSLNDPDFAVLIRFKIFTNNNGSSLYDIVRVFQAFFPGQVFVFDLKTMHLSYLIASGIGSQNLIEAIINEDLLPRPMGVGFTSIIIFPTVNKFFGFVSYESPVATNNSPFNTYEDYQTDWPWLDYAYAIPV